MRLLDCADQDIDYIGGKLMEYNYSQAPRTQERDFIPIHKKLVDEDGRIVAGCIAEIYCWHIAAIDILWVDERCRRRGTGGMLLREVERIAAEAGCTLIHLDTFDFQAKDFYLKQGYEIFGVLEECPEGHCRYYLKKRLGQRADP